MDVARSSFAAPAGMPGLRPVVPSGMTDGYCHCGVSKYLPVEDVLKLMETLEVRRSVLVQHLGEFDNNYLEEAVATGSGRFRAIALVDHRDETWPEQLRLVEENGAFAGVRIPQPALAEVPFPERVLEAGLIATLDLPEGVATSLARIRSIARSRPDVGIVISHLGYPAVENGRLAAGEALWELAGEPNVFVLLSGFSEVCEFPYAPLHGFVRTTLDAFGPSRMMWGSNFPVAGDADACAGDLGVVASLVDDGHEAAAVFGGTAGELWFGGAG